jgi:hypothetical protein
MATISLKLSLMTSTLNLSNTGDLLNSLSFNVQKRGNNYALTYTFLSYGRAIEIQYFKSQCLRRETPIRNRTKAKKKDTRFYSKNAFDSLNNLSRNMMYVPLFGSGLSGLELGIGYARNISL